MAPGKGFEPPASTRLMLYLAMLGIAMRSCGIDQKSYYNKLCVNYRQCIMKDTTTIQLKKSVVKELKNIRKYPRETYNETISDLIKIEKTPEKEGNTTSLSIRFSRRK